MHLIVNTKKGFNPGDHSSLLVHNACITQLYSYKYSLSWNIHVNSVCTRIQQ